MKRDNARAGTVREGSDGDGRKVRFWVDGVADGVECGSHLANEMFGVVLVVDLGSEGDPHGSDR